MQQNFELQHLQHRFLSPVIANVSLKINTEIREMSNRQLEEMQEKLANQKLASVLGISYDELRELEWDIDTNESDDGLIYKYIVTFSE